MQQRRYKHNNLRFTAMIKPTIIVGIFFLILFSLYLFFIPLYNLTVKNGFSRQFLISALFNTKPAFKETKGRTNILLLGISGGDREGSQLTDTIILISIDFNSHDVFMLPIPRDIWIPSLKDKINAAFFYGEKKEPGSGNILVKSAASEVLGQPIHYLYMLDFDGFEKLIDAVGGIDVQISNSFEDNYYPIAGKENDMCRGDKTLSCRYEKLRFEKGTEHMSGQRALKFVRSRQSESFEGSDFARNKRQQQVITVFIQALKDEVSNRNFKKLKTVAEIMNDIVTSEMNLAEKILIVIFFSRNKQIKIRQDSLVTLDDLNKQSGLLYNPPLSEYSGAWVLLPKNGNFSAIHRFVECKLYDPQCTQLPSP